MKSINTLCDGYSKNFTFRCHRTESAADSVNSIAFNPKFKSFATGGGDGLIHIWDKAKKQKVATIPDSGESIVSMSYNSAGSHLAYAVGYDWSIGHNGIKRRIQKTKL